jgi:hypothetical protein
MLALALLHFLFIPSVSISQYRTVDLKSPPSNVFAVQKRSRRQGVRSPNFKLRCCLRQERRLAYVIYCARQEDGEQGEGEQEDEEQEDEEQEEGEKAQAFIIIYAQLG